MENFKDKFLSGIFYTGLSRYIGIFVSLGITAILARILTPHDFGIVAIATVFINFFSTLTTVGVSPAIVQNKEINESDLESINTFILIVAVILTGLYILVVPVISHYYGSQVLETVLYWLSINIFFSVLAIVPNALFLKNKRFKFIAVRSLVIQIILGCISVIAAYVGMGIYSLIINPIGNSVLLYIISNHVYRVRMGAINSTSLSKIFSFSFFQMLYNLVYLGYRNIDKILIGKYMGTSNLGYYEKSYRLMMLPLENVSTVISPVLHPMLSDYQKDFQYLWSVYKKMISFLSEFSFLVSVILYYLADLIIIGLYGDKWFDAIPIFKVLSLSVCFQLLQSPIGAILQAANSVKTLLKCSIWIFLFMVLGLIIAIIFVNFNMIPYMVDIVFIIGFIIYQISLSNIFKESIYDILRIMVPHMFYSVLLFVLLYGVTLLSNSIWIDACLIMVTSFVYIFILFSINQMPNIKKFVLESVNTFKSKI